MKQLETFAEDVSPYKVPDVGFYTAMGVNALERREQWRAVYRLRLDLENNGVKWELLATLNARLIGWEEAEFCDRDEMGERVGLFVARGRDGHGFTFRLAERHFQNSRQILKAIYSHGGLGCVVVPGKCLAMMRAILALSAEGEPMPSTTREEEAQRAKRINPMEEVDPFDDDDGLDDIWNY